jgi:hypothetical protein
MQKKNAIAFFVTFFSALMFFNENISAGQPYQQPLQAIFLLLTTNYIYAIYKKSPEFLLSYTYQIYSFIGMMISSTIIGAGTYMIEINQVGTSNGTFWIALAFFIVGTEASYLSFKKTPYFHALKYSLKPSENATRIIALTIALITIATGIFIFIKYSSPTIIGIDRITFWKQIVPSPLNLFPSILAQTFFLCGFLYIATNTTKAVSSWLIVAYILCSVIVAGEKFSAFILYIFIWLTLKSSLNQKNSLDFKTVVKWLSISSLIGVVVIASYILSDKEAAFVLLRAALQSQLLWSVLNEDSMRLLTGDEWHCYFGCQKFETATDFISAKYLPPDLWDFYSEAGTNLTGFMPAAPILLFGIPGALLLHIVFSALLGATQKQAVYSIKSKNLITSFLLFKIYLGLIIFWYATRIQIATGILTTILALILIVLVLQKKEISHHEV